MRECVVAMQSSTCNSPFEPHGGAVALCCLPASGEREKEREEQKGKKAWAHIENSWHALLNFCKIHSKYNELKAENLVLPDYFISLYFFSAQCVCMCMCEGLTPRAII